MHEGLHTRQEPCEWCPTLSTPLGAPSTLLHVPPQRGDGVGASPHQRDPRALSISQGHPQMHRRWGEGRGTGPCLSPQGISRGRGHGAHWGQPGAVSEMKGEGEIQRGAARGRVLL